MTPPRHGSIRSPCPPTPIQATAGSLHVLSAALFFATLAFFSLALFRLSGKAVPTHRKLARNTVYTGCGYAIIACLLGIGAVSIPAVWQATAGLRPVLWLEAAAVVAFGASWFTKDEATSGTGREGRRGGGHDGGGGVSGLSRHRPGRAASALSRASGRPFRRGRPGSPARTAAYEHL